MALIPVNSSSIRAVGYSGSTLAVLFHSSDKVYEHPGVPYSVYVGLMRAASMGAYPRQPTAPARCASQYHPALLGIAVGAPPVPGSAPNPHDSGGALPQLNQSRGFAFGPITP